MKKMFLFMLLVGLVMACNPVAAEEKVILVNLDGASVLFPDAQPFIDENNRTLVPIGVLAEALGMQTSWDRETQTAKLFADGADGECIQIEIGKNEILTQNGTIMMDTVAVLKDNRVFVPLHYVAVALQFSVEWDGDNFCVNLTSAEGKDFTFALLAAMDNGENYMVSPYSLKVAMAMAANGADGETKQEILDVFGIESLPQFNQAVKSFIANGKTQDSFTLNMANSIWFNVDYFKDSELRFSDAYKNTIRDRFDGEAAEVNNADGAKTINDWISQQTNGRIKEVLKGNEMPNLLSVLVNTIYFKSDWMNPFMAERTKPDVFTERSGSQKTTDFMNDTGFYHYYEDEDFQILNKAYTNGDVTMYFVLPKADKAISKHVFDKAVAEMAGKTVRFSVPKFKTESTHDNLINILEGMGIQAAFSEKDADFARMYSEESIEGIYIGLIRQKTFIAVDEEGTEAAAATVIGMKAGGVLQEIIDFKCNRPFTYFIRHEATGEILFMGEYGFVE